VGIVDETSDVKKGNKTPGVLRSERRGSSGQSKLKAAKEIITEILAHGPRGSNEVEMAWRDAGISLRTYKAARKSLGIVAERVSSAGTGNGC